MSFVTAARWKEPTVCRVVRRMNGCLRMLLAGCAVCAVAGCGASSKHESARPAAARHATSPSTVTATLKAVFVHPEASQCSTSMTARFVSQFFSADAARSGTSVLRTCRDHQRQRAELPKRYRLVTIHDLEVSGDSARAIVRGANGYPIGVSLVASSRGWRLNASGAPSQGPGHGQQVSPQGSLYAYRIPHGFVATGTRIGPVLTSGSAFSTAVGLPGGWDGEGVAVAQTAGNPHIKDLAALRTVLPRVDRAVRGAPIARVIGPPVAHEVGGRPAVTWTLAGVRSETAPTDGKSTFVFSSAANIVVVNCRWPHSGPERAALRVGCDAVLDTLAVG